MPPPPPLLPLAFECGAAMPAHRTEQQLRLALDAPPRPEYESAGGDEARWQQMRLDWASAWGGRLITNEDGDRDWKRWWKQAKKQHGELLVAARKLLVDSPEELTAKIDGLSLTNKWVGSHAPEITELHVSEAEVSPGGHTTRRISAWVVGAEGEDEENHETQVRFSPPRGGFGATKEGAKLQAATHRRREERAVRQLAARPWQRALEAELEYQRETEIYDAELEVRMLRLLERASRNSLKQVHIDGAGMQWWCRDPGPPSNGPSSDGIRRSRGWLGGWFDKLPCVEKQRHLERGCLLCCNVNSLVDDGCECSHWVRLVRQAPPSCLEEVRTELHRQCGPGAAHSFKLKWESDWPERYPHAGFQRRWLASDGSAAARDALLAEWTALDFARPSLPNRREAPPRDGALETRWTLYHAAGTAAAAAAAERAEAEAEAWVVRYLGSRWQDEDALAGWTSSLLCPRADELYCARCPYGSPPKCFKCGNKQDWRRVYPAGERERWLRDLAQRSLDRAHELEGSAALAEASATAFVARWGGERAREMLVLESAALARAKATRERATVRAMAQSASERGLSLSACGLEGVAPGTVV